MLIVASQKSNVLNRLTEENPILFIAILETTLIGQFKLVFKHGDMDMSRANAILEVFHVVLAFAKNSDMSQLSSISL